MKLVAYELDKQPRLGVVEGEWIVSVSAAIQLLQKKRVPRALSDRAQFKNAARRVLDAGAAPKDMIELLERGQAWCKSLGVVASSFVKTIEAAKAPRGLLTPLEKARLLAPIPKPGKITCVGLNYADHAREQGTEPPKAPIFFLKSGNTICGPGEPIQLPPNSSQVDYEAEFAVVIGKRGKRIPEDKAYDTLPVT